MQYLPAISPKRVQMKRKRRSLLQPDTPEELLQRDFTGDCYHATVEWASATKGQGWTVVHGMVRNFEKGRLKHAWCERGEAVIDLAMPVGMREFTRGEYYRVLEPDITKDTRTNMPCCCPYETTTAAPGKNTSNCPSGC